ncbi:MAG: hydroxyacid dehydrogenase [Rhodothermaceae bacterium]|nr:hydroxyacid dehydrogenase [Rhodothermaceae bacterium]MXW33910.1 hydroxyacid dehydrogenase [Rhodothermaceae bacterium]MYC03885.1 hydroxyacid dehydrogenase [Rhodothermaceae bacterium]MYE61794.1 hydroxyacid dehydrogenase [Rhodothermaceae bacterium]MYI16019.1 hydroxyacid dehydrogenase [Rhodothermaceae bacterium]
MRVLIADKLPEKSIEALRQAGHTVVVEICSADQLQEALVTHGIESLVVRSTKVTRSMIQHASSLELIVRAGAGYDSIDLEAASEFGVFVANCPGKNASAVAELTIGLVVSLDRWIPDNVSDARAGKWQKGRYAKARGLKGRVLGLVGMGKIGQLVAQMAQGLGLEVVAWSRSLTAESAAAFGVGFVDNPIQVAAQSDIVSLHVAATPSTFHLADRDFFAAMKPGTLFINTTRGSVVDENALLTALDENGIRAALDVFADEPSYKEGPLTTQLHKHPSVYLTHHIGASTAQAQEATGDEAARVIDTYANTGVVPNCVNIAVQSVATHLITVRHLDKVGVLARVLDRIRKCNLNVQEMENQVFAGSMNAAVARIRVVGKPPEELSSLLNNIQDVLAVSEIKL